MSRGVCDGNWADERGGLKQAPLLWGFSAKTCPTPPLPPHPKNQGTDEIKEGLTFMRTCLCMHLFLSVVLFQGFGFNKQPDICSLQLSTVGNWLQNSQAKYGVLTKKRSPEDGWCSHNVPSKLQRKTYLFLVGGCCWIATLVYGYNWNKRWKEVVCRKKVYKKFTAAVHCHVFLIDTAYFAWAGAAVDLRPQAAVRMPGQRGLGDYYNLPCWHIQTNI